MTFENNSQTGYTTEKIVQAFAARTSPIYWGNPDIGLEFNTAAFVNCHDYDTFDQVIQEVQAIDQDDYRYQAMFCTPYFCKKQP